MAYEGGQSKACARVEAAERAVATAQLKYQRGTGSLDAVVKADANLANAQYLMYEHATGRIPDDR